MRLIHKIVNIKSINTNSKRSLVKQSNTKLQSLNSQKRNKESQRIVKENDKIYKQIKTVKPSFDTRQSLDYKDKIMKTRLHFQNMRKSLKSQKSNFQ